VIGVAYLGGQVGILLYRCKLLEPFGHIDECKFISLLTVLLAQQLHC